MVLQATMALFSRTCCTTYDVRKQGMSCPDTHTKKHHYKSKVHTRSIKETNTYEYTSLRSNDAGHLATLSIHTTAVLVSTSMHEHRCWLAAWLAGWLPGWLAGCLAD